MRLDASSICAALLHDVVEDCNVSEAEMSQRFGPEIGFLVDGVTKLGRIHFTNKEDQQAESFRKMLVAMARDIRVLVVKLADRLDNMRTLTHMKPDSQMRIAQETMEIFAPLAGRLGINWLKSELEDLSFKYLYPEIWADLTQKTKKVQKDHERYISDVVKRLQMMLIERNFPADVSGRMKHLYSIYRKMRQNNTDFEQVHDVLAFRVLVEDVADCYAALGVIHSQWTPIPGRFKDYIALPKSNMYQSLHTTVIGPGQRRIEVQIRTHDMHRTAEDGIAAHWTYKEKGGGTQERHPGRSRARVAAAAGRDPAGRQPRGIPRERASRPVPGQGVRVHAEGRNPPPAAQLDLRRSDKAQFTSRATSEGPAPRRRTLLTTCIPTSAPTALRPQVDRRLVPLQDTAAQRPDGGDHHGERRHAKPGLGQLRSHREGTCGDPPLPEGTETQRGHRPRQAAAQPGAVRGVLTDTAQDSVGAPGRWSRIWACETPDQLFEKIGLGERVAPFIARRLLPADSEGVVDAVAGPLAIAGTEGLLVSYARCCFRFRTTRSWPACSSGRGVVIHREACGNLPRSASSPRNGSR